MNEVRKNKTEGSIEEQIAKYRAGDQVIFQTKSGEWKMGDLEQPPEVVRAKGKNVFQFRIHGEAEPVVTSVPLKKAVAVDLANQMVNIPLKVDKDQYAVKGFRFGPNGEEEYMLEQIGKNKEVRYVDGETLRSIAEATEAAKNVQSEVGRLMNKVKSLEGRKVSELIGHATKLETKAKEIIKVLGSSADWNDMDQGEVAAMTAEVRKLKNEAEQSLKELDQKIEAHQKKFDENVANEKKHAIAAKIDNIYKRKMDLAKKAFEVKDKKVLDAYNKEEAAEKEWERERDQARKSRTPFSKAKPTRKVTTKPVSPDDEDFVRAKELEAIQEYKTKNKSDAAVLETAAQERLGSDEEMVAMMLEPDKQTLYRETAEKKKDEEEKLSEQEAKKKKIASESVNISAKIIGLENEVEQKKAEKKQFSERPGSKLVDLAMVNRGLSEIQQKTKTLEEKDAFLVSEIARVESEAGKSRKEKNKAVEALEAERVQVDLDRLAIETQRGSLEAQAQEIIKDPEMQKLTAFDGEIQDLEREVKELERLQNEMVSNELPAVNAEIENIQGEIKAHEVELKKIRDEARVDLAAEADLEIYREWKGIAFESETKIDLKKEKADLEEKMDQLKDEGKKIPHREQSESVEKSIKVFQKQLDGFKQTDTDLEKELLGMWQTLGRLEVKIFEQKPREVADGEADAVREAREEKESHATTVELPSHVLRELLENVHDADLIKVIELIYNHQLSEGNENGVAIIHGDTAITEAVGGLFDGQPPTADFMNKLRAYGIKDWDKFKVLWKEQYASQVGIILQEQAQNRIKKHVERAKKIEDDAWAKYEAEYNKKFALSKWIFGKKPDIRSKVKDLREEAIKESLGEYKDQTGTKLDRGWFETVTRLMGTAMREINLEIKVYEAENKEEVAEILKKAGRSADQYVEHNRQYFVKNSDERMMRENKAAAGLKMDKETYESVYNQISASMSTANDILTEIQRGITVSQKKMEQLAEGMKNLRAALEGQKGANEMMVAVLSQEFEMHDEASDILYEYTKLMERQRKTETLRVARDMVAESGKKLVKEDEAHGGVAAAVVKHTAPLHTNMASHGSVAHKPVAKSTAWLKAAALVLSIGAGAGAYGVTTSGKRAESGGSSSATVSQRMNQAPRGGISGGGGGGGGARETGRIGGVAEAQQGSIENQTATTTTIEFRGEKMQAFKEVLKKIYPEKQDEVLGMTAKVKNEMFKIPDRQDRTAAVEGLYKLIDDSGDNKAEAQAKLKNVVELASAATPESTKKYIDELVQIGKPFVKAPKAPKAPQTPPLPRAPRPPATPPLNA
jgi:uncharacterized protein YbjQ (UPF0145 family)